MAYEDGPLWGAMGSADTLSHANTHQKAHLLQRRLSGISCMRQSILCTAASLRSQPGRGLSKEPTYKVAGEVGMEVRGGHTSVQPADFTSPRLT